MKDSASSKRFVLHRLHSARSIAQAFRATAAGILGAEHQLEAPELAKSFSGPRDMKQKSCIKICLGVPGGRLRRVFCALPDVLQLLERLPSPGAKLR